MIFLQYIDIKRSITNVRSIRNLYLCSAMHAFCGYLLAFSAIQVTCYTFEKLSDINSKSDGPLERSLIPFNVPVGQQVVWVPYEFTTPRSTIGVPPWSPSLIFPAVTPATTTLAPLACRLVTTGQTRLGCPCNIIGIPCHARNSICQKQPTGDGLCQCITGYVEVNRRCVNRESK